MFEIEGKDLAAIAQRKAFEKERKKRFNLGKLEPWEKVRKEHGPDRRQNPDRRQTTFKSVQSDVDRDGTEIPESQRFLLPGG